MAPPILYLSREDVVATGVAMTDIIKAVEAVFVEKGHGRVEMPPKPGIHPLPDAFIHAMPAYIPKMKAAGMKWVSGFPQNMPKRLPYISGLLILNDVETGFPSAVMDCTWITAVRTGAATAVAAKRLARADSATVAILGCGVQGRSNLEALKAVLPSLTHLQAYDIHRAAAEEIGQLAKQWGIRDVTICANAEAACRDADVIVTTGPILKHPTPVVERRWLKPGCFLSPVDFDSYLQPDVFAAADLFYTDDSAQQGYYCDAGYFSGLRRPDGDLGDLFSGRKRGRETKDDLTIAMNLGIALEDMSAAVLVYDAAVKRKLGRLLPA